MTGLSLILPILVVLQQSTESTAIVESQTLSHSNGGSIEFSAHVVNTNVTSSINGYNNYNSLTHSNKKQRSNINAIPTPATCFDNDYDFYSCCIYGSSIAINCWQGNRTSSLCCQTQSLVIVTCDDIMVC